jgi:Zn-dependent protease with chaperone function
VSSTSGIIELAALAFLAFLFLGSLTSGAVFLLVRQRLAHVPPPRRAQLLLTLITGPVVAGLFLLSLCFLPSLGVLSGLMVDHCGHHDDAHPHLCLVHPPALHVSPARALLVGGMAAAATAALLVSTLRTRRLHRSLAALSLSTTHDPERGVALLDSPLPLSFTAGLFRPRIYLSPALVRSLPAEMVAVVVEHERAHVRRRDGLVLLAARWLSLVHLPGVRSRLLADLSLAIEEACDEEAARKVGDPLRVASTLVAVERFLVRAPEPGLVVPALGGSNIPARVQSLLLFDGTHGTLQVAAPSSVRWLLPAAALAVLASGLIHHATETLLALVVR